jgi:hypothetical protein
VILKWKHNIQKDLRHRLIAEVVPDQVHVDIGGRPTREQIGQSSLAYQAETAQFRVIASLFLAFL